MIYRSGIILRGRDGRGDALRQLSQFAASDSHRVLGPNRGASAGIQESDETRFWVLLLDGLVDLLAGTWIFNGSCINQCRLYRAGRTALAARLCARGKVPSAH